MKQEYLEVATRLQQVLDDMIEKGWSKRRFAEYLGILPTNLRYYLSGHLNPLKFVTKITQLGYDPGWYQYGIKTSELKDKNLKYEVRIKHKQQILSELEICFNKLKNMIEEL